jgi:SAM-dependent methyltransferase
MENSGYKNLQNGIALISELESDDFQRLRSAFSIAENVFLGREQKFRDSSYVWPRSALHNWAGIWEYPYAYLSIQQFVKDKKDLNVLDFGSGITFFPFELTKLKETKSVYTVDNDIVCVDGNKKVPLAFPESSNFQKITPIFTEDGSKIELEDSSIDLIYSISVVEHLDNYNEIIKEIHRLLKPGGRFIFTLDIDLRGDFALSPTQFNDFMEIVSNLFVPVFPYKNLHPKDILSSVNSSNQSEKRSIVGRLKGVLNDISKGELRCGFRDYKLLINCFGGCYEKK